MKSMTTESVSGTFKAAAMKAHPAGSGSGKITNTYEFSKGENAGNRLQQHRNGKPRQFDDAKDRGPAIGSGPGFKPTAMSKA